MLKKLLIGFGIILMLSVATFQVAGLSAGNDLPLDTQISIEGTFTGYNDQYSYTDITIEDDVLDINFLKFLRDDTYLDLTASTFESDESIFERPNDYNMVFINGTWNAESGNVSTVNTELASQFGDTYATGKFTADATATGDTSYDEGIWLSDLSWDNNGDGDFTDDGDLSYMELVSADVYFLVNFKVDTDGTNDLTYGEVKINCKTSSATDYAIVIRHFPQASGDSGWTDLDASGENQAKLNLYDTDDTYCSVVVPLAKVISADAGDSPSIKGINSIQVSGRINGVSDKSKYLEFTIRNIAVFTSNPALTDNTDNDDDYDWNGSGNVAVNLHDDTDIIGTAITEGGTESYDNHIELNDCYKDSISLLKSARYLTFGGVFAFDPTTFSVSSSLDSESGGYLTTEMLTFDSTEIDIYDDYASNIFSWTSWQLNCTLDKSILLYNDNFEDNLVTFTEEGLDKFSTFESAWQDTIDLDKVQYDASDPSTTSGDIDEFVLSYLTDESQVSVSGAGGVASTTDQVAGDLTVPILILGCLAVIVALVWWNKRKAKKPTHKKRK